MLHGSGVVGVVDAAMRLVEFPSRRTRIADRVQTDTGPLDDAQVRRRVNVNVATPFCPRFASTWSIALPPMPRSRLPHGPSRPVVDCQYPSMVGVLGSHVQVEGIPDAVALTRT